MANASAKVTQGQLDRYRTETVVWTNPDSSLPMEAQKLSVNLTGYSYYYIVFKRNKGDNWFYKTQMIPVEKGSISNIGISLFLDGYKLIRSHTVGNDNIDLLDAYRQNDGETRAVNNDYCIPVRIVAIKYNSNGGGLLTVTIPKNSLYPHLLKKHTDNKYSFIFGTSFNRGRAFLS